MALMERMAEKSEMQAKMMGGGEENPAVEQDPTTYDPTQERGTSAWQQSLAMNAALNARRRRGEH